MHSAAEAAEHGVGVALISTRLANERFTQGALAKVFDAELQTGESYYLVTRNEDEQRAEIRALKDWIVDEFSTAA
jgi:DNA-binding transcriptional LysR family regulator